MGDGTTTDRNAPTAQMGPSWVTTDAGGAHSCGVDVRGRAWCWGSDGHGQLGDGIGMVNHSAPVLVAGGATDYRDIDAGAFHTCAIRSGGSLWCWGRDAEGQQGDGNRGQDRSVPNQVPGEGWSQVSAGYANTCATRTDGTLWCWGENIYGQVGAGSDQTYLSSPAQVAGTDWATVTVGSNHACALRTDGTAWCWGEANDGIFDASPFGSSAVPVRVPGSWTAFESGLRHVCGLRADHTAWCWGYNEDGQLGLGFESGYAQPVTVPTQVPGDDWRSLSAGFAMTCGLRLDHTAWCWGGNASGALGDGTTTDSSSPVPVAGGGTWLDISAGHHHVVGVRWPSSG